MSIARRPRRVLRLAALAYFAATTIVASVAAITAHRAFELTGEWFYPLSQTKVFVMRQEEPETATDAEFDALFADAGESTQTPAEIPMLVLGVFDAVLPVVVGGGVFLGVLAATRRRAGW